MAKKPKASKPRRAKTSKSQTAPIELRDKPAPIDPKQPVRGLGAWLEHLARMAAGYEALRGRLSVFVFNEASHARHAESEYTGAAARTRPLKELAAAREYSAAAVREKAGREIIPALTLIVQRVDECLDAVTPAIDGICRWLAALPAPMDAGIWETELALAVRKTEEAIKRDRGLLEFDTTFDDAQEFSATTNKLKAELSPVVTELIEKSKVLASVALTPPGQGLGAGDLPGDGSPFYKPIYFMNWDIGDELLRRNSTDEQAHRPGKVRRQKQAPRNGKKPARATYHYSELDARRLWPEKFAE